MKRDLQSLNSVETDMNSLKASLKLLKFIKICEIFEV